MPTKMTGVASGAETMEAAQRGFAAFGAAQELTVKALMRAATRQAELARETMTDCMSAAAGMHVPTAAEDGQDQMRRAGMAAETWFRTWRSITEDLRDDLLEAAGTMMSAMPMPPGVAPMSKGATRKPASPH